MSNRENLHKTTRPPQVALKASQEIGTEESGLEYAAKFEKDRKKSDFLRSIEASSDAITVEPLIHNGSLLNLQDPR